MRVSNEDRSPLRIHGRDAARTSIGFAEAVSNDSWFLRKERNKSRDSFAIPANIGAPLANPSCEKARLPLG
jgi:hypothetical protein